MLVALLASYPPRFYLRPDEKIVRADRITPAWGLEQALLWFIGGAIAFGAMLVGVFFLPPENRTTLGPIVVAGFALFWLVMLLVTWRRIVTSEYVVTDEAVYARRGQLVVTVDAASLDRVTDLHVHTGIVGRLFGYSDLLIKTAGGGLAMPGLKDAYSVRSMIHEVRHRLLARLLREAGRREAPTGASAGPDIQCPRCLFVFPLTGKPPIDVQCPHCHATGTLFPEALG
jgi:membrane protein YdbS with pleckstrin-like domain